MRSDPSGGELRWTILALAQEGHTKEDIYGAMLELLDLVREKHDGGESAEEDIILELMDALTGWCHPSARLP